MKKILYGDPVAILEGKTVNWRTLLKKPGKILNNAFRFGPETYLMPKGIGEYLNHSCRPNAGLQKRRWRLYLVAITQIQKGDEITFDYSTQIGRDDIWRMKCNCGKTGCRRTIKSFPSIPKRRLEKYLKEKIIPQYILHTAK